MIRLVGKYVSEAGEYKPMDFAMKANYLTLDVISEISYGKSFGHLEQDADVYEHIKMMEETIPAVMMVTVLP